MSAGQSLHDAIEGNDKFRVKLSTAVNVTDAHAIDIRYHKKCWANNVSSVLRQPLADSSSSSSSSLSSFPAPGEIAAKIELLTTAETALKNGNLLNMSDLHAAYDSILKENGIANKTCSRKTLKQLIQNNVAGVEFHKPKRVNESERVSIKETRDVAMI